MSALTLWGYQILLSIVLAITGYNVAREVNRMDAMEEQIQETRRDVVKFNMMCEDIKEIRSNVMKLLLKVQP